MKRIIGPTFWHVPLPLVAVLFCLLSACSSKKPVELAVIVKNQETGQAIGKARLSLYKFYEGGSPQLVDTFLTNEEGKPERMEIKVEKDYRYKMSASKAYYEAALAGNGVSYANEKEIDPRVSDTLTLFLNPLDTRSSAMTNRRSTINVNELIGRLKAGQWEGNSLPRLNWGDIDALLEVGGDTTVIQHFPIKTGSSLKPDSARLGQVALWMIEAIRRDVSKKREDKPVFLMPPSNVPVLGTRRGNPRLFNSKYALDKAHKAYTNWWEGKGEADTLRTARRNPLRGTKLSWM